MEQVIEIDYNLGYTPKLPLEVSYYYSPSSPGDYYTPPTHAEVYIEKIKLCDFDIAEIVDDSFAKNIEEIILKAHDDKR